MRNELVFSTSKAVNTKPTQIIEREGTQYKAILKCRTITIRDSKGITIFNGEIPTGKNRLGRKYMEHQKESNKKYLDTINALKKVNSILN